MGAGAGLPWTGGGKEKWDLVCPKFGSCQGSFLLPLHPQASTGIEVMPPVGTSCRQGLYVRTVRVIAGPGASSMSQS